VLTVDLKRLGLSPGQKVLDVGCGTGRHVCALTRMEGLEVIGSDIKYSELAEARKRLEYEYEWHTYRAKSCGLVAASINLLPFRDGFFDAVLCTEVLEHLPDISGALKELTRVVKHGGQLAVSVPRYYPEKICWWLSRSYAQSSDGHVRIFRATQLKHEIERHGFINWASHYAHSLHTPYWWLKCVVGMENSNALVRKYQQFLEWEIMNRPRIIRVLDSILNPVLGKSLVMYFKKVSHECS